MDDNEFYEYAYAPRGIRYDEANPGHKDERISMIGSLCQRKFDAPFMFEGHCNTKLFERYFEKVLLPTLKPESVVIIDNAAFHKSVKIEKMAKDNGHRLLYLPPYSPDFNRIEKFWPKIKTDIKKSMRKGAMKLKKAMDYVLRNMSLSL